MNQSELVEAIVKEVKRVLALRGIQVASTTEEVSQKAAASLAPAQKTQPGGSQDLTCKKVITQKQLEPFQGQTVTVAKKVVITPLAMDYARDKNITINRVDKASSSVSALAQPVVTVALAIAPDFPGDGSVVKKFLSAKGFFVNDVSGKSYEAAIGSLAAAVGSGMSTFGVCIEKNGMEGPIYANRNRIIRAVHCRETMDARAARVDIGANVVIIDAVSNPEVVLSGFLGL